MNFRLFVSVSLLCFSSSVFADASWFKPGKYRTSSESSDNFEVTIKPNGKAVLDASGMDGTARLLGTWSQKGDRVTMQFKDKRGKTWSYAYQIVDQLKLDEACKVATRGLKRVGLTADPNEWVESSENLWEPSNIDKAYPSCLAASS